MAMTVIGSCVTRDVFTIGGHPLPRRFDFVARSSFATMFAPSTDLEVNAVNSDWQNRALQAELRKTVPAFLLDNRPEIIVIDLIDERFDLYEIGGTLLNVGAEFIAAGINVASATRVISRLSEEAFDLWVRGAARFAELVSSFSPKIFVHKARWAKTYIQAGRIQPFPAEIAILPGQKVNIDAHNSLLGRMEGHLSTLFPAIGEIAVNESNILADAAHRWGRSPFHYVTPYYSDFLDSCDRSGLDFLRGALTVADQVRQLGGIRHGA